MDTKKLRQKILDLAIRGKLVPQDPNDEPASVLLERIRAEKEQLIKEGKIKRTKKSNASDTSHYENVPFEVPEGWCWSNLINICHIFGRIGFRGYTKEDLVKHDGAITLSPSNIIEGKMNYNSCTYISWNKYDESPEIQIQENDILLVKTGSSYGKCALVEKLPKQATINPQFVVLKHISCNPEYLTYVLQSKYAQNNYEKFVLGTAIPTFTQVALGNMQIPIPPLTEQNRIVKEIKRLLGIIESLESNKKHLKEIVTLSKSKILEIALSGKLISQNTYDEPAIELLKRINPSYQPCDNRHYENIQINIPNTWCWGKVGDLFEHNTGKALNSSNTNGSMLNYITTSNLYWDRFDLTVVKQMRFTDSEIEKCKATKGDLLLCEGGDVGRAAIWNYDFDIMIQNHIHRLRGKVDVSSRFFFYVFMLYKQKNYIGGKGVAIQGLSSRDLHNLPIPIPPLKEQYRIADTLDNLIAKMDKITAEL